MALPEDASDAGSAAAITRLLNQACDSDAQAAAELLPLVYQQLRALAASKMRHEGSDQTLQATALVHEAYLRLVNSDGGPRWDGRGHFFAAAAEAMRRILVESARRRGRLKRGAAFQRIELSLVEPEAPRKHEDVLALDEALEKLEALDPRKAEVVKLRFFAGLTNQEAAEALGISTSTADSDWAYARAWLRVEMEEEH